MRVVPVVETEPRKPVVFWCNAGEHMVEFTPDPNGGGTGYATNQDGTYRTCYECCARVDWERMIATGNSRMLPLYWDETKGEVTNWPGTLRFRVTGRYRRQVRAGFCGTVNRTDVWFNGPDGYVWHGFSMGDTQICHCKRTRQRTSTAS